MRPIGWMWMAYGVMAALGCSAPVAPTAPVSPARAAAVAAPATDALARFAADHPASRLDAVAEIAARSAADDAVVSAPGIQAAMATALGSGAWPHVLTGWGSDDEIAHQLEAALAELRDVTEIAELGFATARGRAGHVGVIVAVPPPSLPLSVERSGRRVRVQLAWAWSDDAAVYAVTPSRSRRLELARTGEQLAVAIDCADPVALEIRAGTRVIATVVDACAPVLAAGELPPEIDLGPPAHTRVEIEMRVWELVNRERLALGVAAVAWDEAGHRFARDHAADMARFHYVSHRSPDGASYHDRVAAAPFLTRLTRENVGHAWGPGEIHEAFMRSAGHRANLLADEVERGAVGVAVDPEDPTAFYATEFFRR